MSTSAVTFGIWHYKQRSGALSPFPVRQQHQPSSWLPVPSNITPLAGMVNPLPCLVAAGLVILVLIHGICFSWALVRTLPWCSAPPTMWIRGGETPYRASAMTARVAGGAWAPCLHTFQDTYHPPLLYLPCPWLIQAAQGAGNSSQKHPSSPALILSESKSRIAQNNPREEIRNRRWPPSNPQCWGLRCGPSSSFLGYSRTFVSFPPGARPSHRLVFSTAHEELSVPRMSHGRRLGSDISPSQLSSGCPWHSLRVGLCAEEKGRECRWEHRSARLHQAFCWGGCHPWATGGAAAEALFFMSASRQTLYQNPGVVLKPCRLPLPVPATSGHGTWCEHLFLWRHWHCIWARTKRARPVFKSALILQ